MAWIRGRDRALPEGTADLVELDEKEILRRCQQGDGSAFAVLMERYQERVHRVAFHVLGDHDEARDVCQEAFLKVFRSIDRYQIERHFYTWLYKIVLNMAIDFLRRKKTSEGWTNLSIDSVQEVEDPGRPPSARLEDRDLARSIDEALDQVPDPFRAVLVLRNVEGFNCREISDLLGTKHTTVRWQLHKARQLFMEAYRGEKPPSPEGCGSGAREEQS